MGDVRQATSKIQCQTENFFYQRFDFVSEFTRYVKWLLRPKIKII
jgi:hypothetical protein